MIARDRCRSARHLSVTLRNIVQNEDDVGISNPQPKATGYGVMTRFRRASIDTDQAKKIVPVFEANGALMLRAGTVVTGHFAGIRLLSVAYPSMDAIEKTYAALPGNAAYKAYVADMEVLSRDIVRLMR